VAEIVGPGNVYSVEYVPELAESARKRLRQLGYDVTVWAGDGQIAFRDEAPFDVAYLTCAPADGVPDSIVDRVQTGGRVVAPVGRVGAQRLVRLTVKEGASSARTTAGPVRSDAVTTDASTSDAATSERF